MDDSDRSSMLKTFVSSFADYFNGISYQSQTLEIFSYLYFQFGKAFSSSTLSNQKQFNMFFFSFHFSTILIFVHHARNYFPQNLHKKHKIMFSTRFWFHVKIFQRIPSKLVKYEQISICYAMNYFSSILSYALNAIECVSVWGWTVGESETRNRLLCSGWWEIQLDKIWKSKNVNKNMREKTKFSSIKNEIGN